MVTHTKRKNFKCQICSLTFTQSQNLKRHLLVHTGEKQYECSECDKKFGNKYNLQVSSYFSFWLVSRYFYIISFINSKEPYTRTIMDDYLSFYCFPNISIKIGIFCEINKNWWPPKAAMHIPLLSILSFMNSKEPYTRTIMDNYFSLYCFPNISIKIGILC